VRSGFYCGRDVPRDDGERGTGDDRCRHNGDHDDPYLPGRHIFSERERSMHQLSSRHNFRKQRGYYMHHLPGRHNFSGWG
jgi:hypothetical protein